MVDPLYSQYIIRRQRPKNNDIVDVTAIVVPKIVLSKNVGCSEHVLIDFNIWLEEMFGTITVYEAT